jgi:hypothetical protein
MWVGVLGGMIYASAGAVMGAMNAGWFGLDREANATLPALGVGAALVVFAFSSSELHAGLRDAGGLGRATQLLLVIGPSMYVLSWWVEFAILGTLALGIGLICLSVAAIRRRLVPPADRVLIVTSAVGSLTWNTETLSAFLLVGVGLIWALLSVRLLRSEGMVRTG